MKYKICKNCGAKNDIDAMFCVDCKEIEFDVIEDVIEYNEKDSIDDLFEKEESTVGMKTTIDKKPILKLINQNFTLTIENDLTVGREAFGSQYLNEYDTVSRNHLNIFYKNDSWYIKDLNSTNGTYLNYNKIIPNQEYKINNNDSIKLSSKLEFKVKIE